MRLVMRVIWRSPATPPPADLPPLPGSAPTGAGPGSGQARIHRKWLSVHPTHPKATFGKSGRPASQPAFLQSAAKPSESRLAPPTRAPSTSGCDISSATFFAFTDPP